VFITRRLQGDYKAFTVQVPVPITMLSDQDILAELNRRNKLVKFSRKRIKKNE
jgi:hypothetical protein